MNKSFVNVRFEKMNEIDSRFTKTKIYLMHTGQNFNGSSFVKEDVDKTIHTLANTPILGFIREYENGEKDFAGHEMELEILEGEDEEVEFNWKYVGQAYGVIPETNNAHWEMVECEDGITREYLVCEGYLWNKLEGSDLMNEFGQTAQSMEIVIDKAVWENEEYKITDFRFDGACILAKNDEWIQPAMINSNIQVVGFSKDGFVSQFSQMLNELKTSLEGGGEPMEKENKFTEDEQVVDNEEKVVDDEQVQDEQVVEDNESVEDETSEENEETSEEVNEENEEFVEDNQEEVVEDENEEEQQDDQDQEEEVVYTKEQYDALLDQVKKLNSELESLREFERDIKQRQKEEQLEEVFNRYSLLLSEDEMQEVRNNKDLSINEVESQLATIFTNKKLQEEMDKKAKFSKGDKSTRMDNFREDNVRKDKFAIR